MKTAAHVPRWPTRNPLARRQLRREADRVLRTGVDPSVDPPLLGVRAAELTSPHERRTVAHSLRGLLDELDGKTLPGPSPVFRPGVRPYARRIAALERRLGDTSSPVTARGMLMVHELLIDPDGPLYDHHRAGELPDRIDDALDALDGR